MPAELGVTNVEACVQYDSSSAAGRYVGHHYPVDRWSFFRGGWSPGRIQIPADRCDGGEDPRRSHDAVRRNPGYFSSTVMVDAVFVLLVDIMTAFEPDTRYMTSVSEPLVTVTRPLDATE